MKCDICEGEIDVQVIAGAVAWDQGHNAWPVSDGRCCSTCNWTRVIPARLEMVLKEKSDGQRDTAG